ncbi:MAG: PRC and DUF2382 domain-containing protein, partial [Solirubrobacterales bacterium]|nr:PRC and DUF2382 domain-containing protein [Solirubrobacterales bacterium]
MPATTETYEFRGRTLVDRTGENIGKIDQLYYDDQGGQPEWATVNTGLFGTKSHFVPLAGASQQGEQVRVEVTKEQVKGAPSIDPDGELSEQEELRLFEHYGVPYTESGSVTAEGRPADAPGNAGRAAAEPRGGAEGRDLSGPTTDEAMTRSEEELRVGTAQRERGRARLRKYVITEQVTKTVPVQREEVRIEREPITDENVDQALEGPAISEEEHEIVLHEEEPVIEKRAVPKERVRLGKETVTDEHEISEEVRKEQIDTEGADPNVG